MRLRMTMAALVLALTGAGEARAATLYAAPGASHDAECAAADPCSLFQARLLAEPSDTLSLAPGRYDGEGNVIFDVPVTRPRSPRSRSRSRPAGAAGRRARTPYARRSPRAGRSRASMST